MLNRTISTHFDHFTVKYLVASGFMGLANGSFDAVFNFFLATKGLSKAEVGTIYSISMVGMSIAVILQGMASRRFGLRLVHRVAALQFALALFVIPFCGTVLTTGLVLSVVSGGFVGMLSTGAAIFGNRVAPDARVRLFSAFFVSYLGCAMVGSLAAAGFANISLWSAQGTYIAVLLAAGVLALIMCFFRETSIGMNPMELPQRHNAVQGSARPDWFPLSTLFAASFMMGGSILLVFRFSNLIFTDVYQMSVGDTAVVLGVEKLFALAGALVAPGLKQRVSHRLLIGTLTVVAVASLLLQAALPTLGLFLLGYFLRITLNYTTMPILDAVSISAFTKGQSIVSTSTRQLAFYAGGAVAAIAYGALLQAGDAASAVALAAVMAALGGALLLLVREHLPVAGDSPAEESPAASART